MTPEKLSIYERESCGELSCDECNERREELITALRGYMETMKDIQFRVNDIRQSVQSREDEWSTNTVNLKALEGIIDKILKGKDQ